MNQEEKERIFQELQAEIRTGLEAYERGECITLEEACERILGSETLFKKLQSEINQSIADIEKGNYHTREELMKRYGIE